MADHVGDQVGTELLFENDRVRVWDLTLRPGEASPRHHHQHDYLFVQITAGKIEVHEGEGEPSVTETAPGFVQYTDVGSGIVHHIVNRGDAPYREFLIELKGPSRSATPQEPQTNGRERSGEA